MSINNKMYIIYALIIAYSGFSCNSKNYNKTILQDKPTVEQVLSSLLNDNTDNFRDRVYSLNKLIFIDSISAFYLVCDSINPLKKETFFRVKDESHIYQGQHLDLPRLFEICIQKEDSIYIDGLLARSCNIKKALTDYYRDIINLNRDVPYKQDSIPYFGIISIPQLIVNLGINTEQNGKLSNEELIFIIDCLNKIIEFYENIRNEISISIFGKLYSELDFRRKLAIIKLRPINILIDLNMTFCSTTVFLEDAINESELELLFK